MVALISTSIDVMQGEKPYRIEDVCQRFGVTYRTVSNWINAGKLPAYRLGRCIFITREALNSFAEPAACPIAFDATSLSRRELKELDAAYAEAAELLR